MLLYGRKSLHPCTVPSSTYSRKPLNMSYGTYGCVRLFFVSSFLSFSVHIMAFYCVRRKWNQHALNKYTLHMHMRFLIFYVFGQKLHLKEHNTCTSSFTCSSLIHSLVNFRNGSRFSSTTADRVARCLIWWWGTSTRSVCSARTSVAWAMMPASAKTQLSSLKQVHRLWQFEKFLRIPTVRIASRLLQWVSVRDIEAGVLDKTYKTWRCTKCFVAFS